MKTLRQLFHEFWLPLTLARVWTIYALITDPPSANFKSLVKTFGPAFFFVSWATGQFLRVRKQSHVDSNLKNIQTRLEGLLSQLEARTTEIVAHITGGNSFCYARLFKVNSQTNMAQLLAINDGAHTVFDAHVRVVDLECMERSVASKGAIPLESCDMIFAVPSMITSMHVAEMVGQLSLGEATVRRFNIFWSARNGDWIQLLRLVKVNGNWSTAIRVMRGNEVLIEEIQNGIPLESLGPEWKGDKSAQQRKTS